MLFDYYTLKIIWWLFVGVLLIGFAVTDGFDLGVGTLLPFVAKTDEQRTALDRSLDHHHRHCATHDDPVAMRETPAVGP